jgi:hypothetical protein
MTKADKAYMSYEVPEEDHDPWEFLERNQYEIGSLVNQLIFIAVVIILGVLI